MATTRDSLSSSAADAVLVALPTGEITALQGVPQAIASVTERIHAVGIVGVSAGPFGGARVIQNLLPVMRELGLVTIFWDVNFSIVQKVFTTEGTLLDDSYIRRIDKFLKELIWMARTLRHGREQIALH